MRRSVSRSFVSRGSLPTSRGSGRWSFVKMLAMCFSTAPTVSTSSAAMPPFERPSAISASNPRSRAAACRVTG